MPRIRSIATALPEHIIAQSDAKEFAATLFGEAFGGDIDRLVAIYDNGEIDSRHFCMPKQWFAADSTFAEKNDLYIEHGLALSESAVEQCLAAAGLQHDQVDYLIFVSTTGLATPSMDARLIERLPFRRTIKRMPLWGLGCAGGASSLSRAMEIARAVPTARILVVVLELCGLTFLRNDLSKSALIATSLFGDGAAAILVAGDDVESTDGMTNFPELLDSFTNTMPASLDVMGWQIGGDGFKVVISRDIPTIVRTFMRESIETFLERHGLGISDIEHFVAHPGGAKVLQAYQESLELPPDKLRHTREVLRRYGNISAGSVIFVLRAFVDEVAARGSIDPAGEYGVLCALGPGFTAEIVLIRWGM